MQIEENQFTSYILTEVEQDSAKTFTPLQLAGLKNLLAKAMLDKAALTVDTSNVTAFIQQEAELKGEIGVLSYLIQTAEESTTL